MFESNMEWLMMFFFFLDLLRPGAANQQKVARKEDKTKKEIGVHTPVKL